VPFSMACAVGRQVAVGMSDLDALFLVRDGGVGRAEQGWASRGDPVL
jgi:hypothetical protein